MTLRLTPSSLALALALPLVLGACTDDAVLDDGESLTTTEDSSTDATTPGDGDPTTGDGDGDPGDGDGDPVDPNPPEVAWPTLDCDPLVPEYCGLPFPNNVFSMDDPESSTGRRVALSEALLPVGANYHPDPDLWFEMEGFSPTSTMLTFLPGATVEGLPTPVTIEDSLAPDCPTVLLDTQTGERVPHWAELDMSHGVDSQRMFMIRPAVRLEPDRRYIVAIRGVVDQDGATLEPSEGFAALRDLIPSEDASIEERRGLYADIFANLAEVGVARGELQLAWDFTTNSDANITERLVHMRDEGLAMFEAGPQFQINTIDENPEPGLALRIEGDLIVPLYLDAASPGGRMNFGPDGLPEPVAMTSYPFLALVPTSAYSEPAGLVQFGHGLFGSYLDTDDGLMRSVAIDYNFIVFGTTWIGMSSGDLGYIFGLLQYARLDEFDTVVDRLAQGVFNGLAAMRMMQTTFALAPELDGPGPNNGPPMIDPTQSYFFGASLGGIMGSPYMALTTDVERGALIVPGQPFSLLLNRSVAFVELSTLSALAYDNPLDVRFALELMAQVWDRAEPSGYSRHIIDDPLPGTDPHEVLVAAALGDHLVTNLGTHVMVRELGIPQLTPVNRSLFGIDEVDAPYAGSALIEYDFGLPPIPLTNVPMSEGSDPHTALADVPIALQTVEQFLRTGVVESFCTDVCDPD